MLSKETTPREGQWTTCTTHMAASCDGHTGSREAGTAQASGSVLRTLPTRPQSQGGIRLQCRRPRFDSWVRKIRWRRDRLPTPLSLGFPGGSAGKESACNAGDLGLIPGLGRSPGEGKHYPLQYSGLENSMDYVIHGVAELNVSKALSHSRPVGKKTPGSEKGRGSKPFVRRLYTIKSNFSSVHLCSSSQAPPCARLCGRNWGSPWSLTSRSSQAMAGGRP